MKYNQNSWLGQPAHHKKIKINGIQLKRKSSNEFNCGEKHTKIVRIKTVSWLKCYPKYSKQPVYWNLEEFNEKLFRQQIDFN